MTGRRRGLEAGAADGRAAFVEVQARQVPMTDDEDFIRQLGMQLDPQFERLLPRSRPDRAKAEATPIVEVSPTVLGPWGSLAESVVVLSAASAGISGASE